MKYPQIILTSIFALVFINSPAQSQPSLTHKLYLVDKKVDDQVRKFSWADTGTLKKSMRIKVLRNSTSFFDQTLNCYTKSFLINDTIYITGYMLGELGWGFQLVVFKDSCIAASFGLSDEKIYKYNIADTDSSSFILLPNVSQKVVLSKQPAFQNDEIVAGVIEIRSVPYYYASLGGKFTIDLKAYFKTAALKQFQ